MTAPKLDLERLIMDFLGQRTGDPQSVAQMAAAMPGASAVAIESTCYALREQQKLGRKGQGVPARPFRFYRKDSQTSRRST